MKQFDIDQIADALAGLSVALSPFVPTNITARNLLYLMIAERYISKEYLPAILNSLKS